MPDSTPTKMTFSEGVSWITPDGDHYAANWDPVSHHVVLILVEPGNRKASSGTLCVTPQSGNSIQLCPRLRSR